MAAIQRMDAALNMWLAKQVRDIHTNIRAVVVDVDYSIPSATVQPMASTVFSDGTEEKIPAVFDVPLQMSSGNGGKARLTMPVKPGDIVGLSFSERNEDDPSDISTHGIYGGWAVTSVHTSGNAMQIHPENVELWNDKVHIELQPDGSFMLKGPVGELKVDADGTFSFGNGASNIKAGTDGFVEMNGAKVTPGGDFITARGVSMNDFYDAFTRHTHPYYWTSGSGNDNTGTQSS